MSLDFANREHWLAYREKFPSRKARYVYVHRGNEAKPCNLGRNAQKRARRNAEKAR